MSSDTKKQGIKISWLKFCQQLATKELLLALIVAMAIIVVSFVFGWENNKLIPLNPASSAHYLLEPHNPLSFLANWDGRDYLYLAQHGYTQAVQANFFPLYPLVVHLVHYALSSFLLSGLIVSWVSLVGAVYFYLKIIKQLYKETDNLEALRAVLLFVLFPTGIFLVATYSTSLFACLALGAVYFALKRRYLPAAALSALATATHDDGVFVLVLVLLLALEQKQKPAKIIASLIVGSLGLITYMVFLGIHFHHPLAFIDAQKANGWLHYHVKTLKDLVSLQGLFVVLVALSAWYWWRRRKSFAIYSLLYVAIVLLGETGGFGRYALVAFPLQLMAYDYFKDKKLGYLLVLALSSAFWMYFVLQYAAGYTGG